MKTYSIIQGKGKEGGADFIPGHMSEHQDLGSILCI